MAAFTFVFPCVWKTHVLRDHASLVCFCFCLHGFMHLVDELVVFNRIQGLRASV